MQDTVPLARDDHTVFVRGPLALPTRHDSEEDRGRQIEPVDQIGPFLANGMGEAEPLGVDHQGESTLRPLQIDERILVADVLGEMTFDRAQLVCAIVWRLMKAS